MKILVTGGAGFIGANFVSYTLRNHPEDRVTVLDKLTYAGRAESMARFKRDPRFRFVKGDICDHDIVDHLVRGSDAVVHFAAETHVDRSVTNASEFVRTNMLGTQNLLDACIRNGNTRFHHVSTDEVYGSLGPMGLFSETSPYDPRSPYSASKAGSDHLVRAAFHTNGLPVTLSNCSNNYGPYQFPEKVVPLFITNLIEGKKVPLYGDGANVRDWIYVEDHCEGVDRALRDGRPGETYLFGGRAERSNAELTNILLFEMGMSSDMIQRVKDRPGHDLRYGIDFSKAEKEFGWYPKTPFLHGIRRTIAWYRQNTAWWKPLKQEDWFSSGVYSEQEKNT
ncbi:MAG: dTDP-glucose 4,6-dehydratase [bacterium]|nr:dTDP-glucose 4,6-dehydratase [bacterium]